MQFLQAKNGNNKLGVYSNLPYAIDGIEIEEDGILMRLVSYYGNSIYVRYRDIKELKKEFNVVNAIGEIEKYKEYG
jgi:hypothetical protein